MSNHNVHRCPICNGELQATREIDFVGVTINRAGDYCHDRGEVSSDLRVYCENDHTGAEIRAALADVEARAIIDADAQHEAVTLRQQANDLLASLEHVTLDLGSSDNEPGEIAAVDALEAALRQFLSIIGPAPTPEPTPTTKVHSLGPWRHSHEISLTEHEFPGVKWGADVINAPDACVNEIAYVTRDSLYSDETDANTRLIVAAPDLLEACRIAVDGNSMLDAFTSKTLTEAIAKASAPPRSFFSDSL